MAVEALSPTAAPAPAAPAAASDEHPASGEGCEAARRACALFDEQLAVVKTVKNNHWLKLVQKMESGLDFRTSVSLPPPKAVGMHLFGKVVRQQCAGLVWDRSKLDLSAAHIWPSGYMAKTEFNLTRTGELLNGRADALVSMEHLLECNISLTSMNPYTGETSTVEPGELPFNEINFEQTGTDGVESVFVRSTEQSQVLHAMGVVALLKHTLGLSLPIIVLDCTNPVHPLSHQAQLATLKEVANEAEQLPSEVNTPRLPLDVESFSELTDFEKLAVHARYGITAACLQAIFQRHAVQQAGELGFVARVLKQAVQAKNVPSAREVVRASAPFMEVAEGASTTSTILSKIGFSMRSSVVDACRKQFMVEMESMMETHKDISDEMLVALGAEIELQEFCAGHTRARIQKAIQEVGQWLQQASHNCTVCDLKSWLDTYQQDSNSKMAPFLTGKAMENRGKFLRHLKKLEETREREAYVRELYDCMVSLHSPCLRFRILREVLGLNERYSRNVVHAIVCFAYDMHAGHVKTLFEVDEATRLEAAEAGSTFTRQNSDTEVLGVPVVSEVFSCDPLGQEARQVRAQYRDGR